MSLLEVDRVSHAYGKQAVVRDLSFSLAQGEIACLLGSSGCGKTTMLRLIAGFEAPFAGSIRLNGVTIANERIQVPAETRRIGMVFQDYALFPHLSIAANIGFGLREKSALARRQRVDEMLELIGLANRGDRYPHELSGGQQQRVALARALAPQPKVLLFDEPLSALDLKLRQAMQIELKRLQVETGITFVFVTHDQEEALTMSDRVGVMSNGKLQQVGTPKEIYTRPKNRFVASFIGETNFVSATADGGKVRLASGDLVEFETPFKGDVTLTVRPEQLRLVPASEAGAIAATISNLVYFGTDTYVHLELADRTELVARVQSPATGDAGFEKGSKIGVRFAPGSLAIVGD